MERIACERRRCVLVGYVIRRKYVSFDGYICMGVKEKKLCDVALVLCAHTVLKKYGFFSLCECVCVDFIYRMSKSMYSTRIE